MKPLLLQYAGYNKWANQKIADALLALPGELHMKEVPSSFPRLQDTCLHMWNASSVWWQRIKLQERIVFPMENFSGGLADILSAVAQQDQLWVDWIGNSSEAALDHVVQYYNSKKEYFKQPVYEIIMHVMNHNTYHRGQLVTMMRQLGVEKIPGTDMVLYTRGK